MFEGFSVPPLTVDSERNAMYKQLQCRPVAVRDVPLADEELVLDALGDFCRPKRRPVGDPSHVAATAFTTAYLEWVHDMEVQTTAGRRRFACRCEYPSLWETLEVRELLEEKLRQANALQLEEGGTGDPPRATVATS